MIITIQNRFLNPHKKVKHLIALIFYKALAEINSPLITNPSFKMDLLE